MQLERVLAERLKERRMSKSLTQSELAELANVPQSAICETERGERMPKGDTLSKIALALKTTTSYLLGETDNSQQSA